MMHIAVISSFYPNSMQPQRAIFVRNLVVSLNRCVPVSVVAPVPYVPTFPKIKKWREYANIPPKEMRDGIDVYHPRYLVIPKLAMTSGSAYMVSILHILRQLRSRDSNIVVHGHCIYPDGVGIVAAARYLGIRCVLTAHGSDINFYASRWGLRGQIRWALRQADYVITVSSDLQQRIRAISGVSSLHIPCGGFDPELFYPRERSAARVAVGLPVHGKVVLFVGRFVAVKAVDTLVEAWRQLYQAGAINHGDRLVLVGDGELETLIQANVGKCGLNNLVTFVGNISQQDVPMWMNSANVLCLPSFMEGTPNVIIEALACGVPVVATEVGGIPEVVEHNQNGMLVPAGNAEVLAVSLAQALERDWDRVALRASVSSYTWSNLANRNYAVLQAIDRGGL